MRGMEGGLGGSAHPVRLHLHLHLRLRFRLHLHLHLPLHLRLRFRLRFHFREKLTSYQPDNTKRREYCENTNNIRR